jgi:hypothetical protein
MRSDRNACGAAAFFVSCKGPIFQREDEPPAPL